MLSRKNGFVFIHLPKTAGNALQHALLPYSDDEIVLTAPHHDGLDRFEVASPGLAVCKHATVSEYQSVLGAEVFNALFLFVTVRNPWERCVSHFFSPHRGPVEWSPEHFTQYISKHVLPLQHYLALPDDQSEQDAFDRLDAVIRFEHLSRDFAAVARSLGLPSLPLEPRNVGDHQPYQHYYTDEAMIEIVASRFALEINQFGYRFR